MTRVTLSSAFAAAVLATAAGVPLIACSTSTVPRDDAASEFTDDETPGLPDAAPDTGSAPAGLSAPFSCVVEDVSLGQKRSDREAYELLRTQLGLDYLAVRYGLASDDAAATNDRDAVGSPCSGATDAASCQAQLAALPLSTDTSFFTHVDWGPGSLRPFLVYTRGDEVGALRDRAQMLALLGAIDSPAKAWLVARQAGYVAQCEAPWLRSDGTAFVLWTSLEVSSCPFRFVEVLVRVDVDGTVTELERGAETQYQACAGRRPEGLALAAHPAGTGGYFAHVAQLEAASIDAFYILRDELQAHGAPAALVERAARSARDEIRHARRMDRLAARFGTSALARPTITRGPVRSLEDIALENAREGCVREAYGALEATWQAHFSTDLEVRRVLQAIARDETRHAELALDVAAWLDSRLDAAGRRRVRAAREAALRELRRELIERPNLGSTVGLPRPPQALDLLRQLEPLLREAA